jgi:hypothetical protein
MQQVEPGKVDDRDLINFLKDQDALTGSISQTIWQ